MRRTHHRLLLGCLLLLAPFFLFACDASSPSEPGQVPGTPPGTSPPNAVYDITIVLTPDEVPQGSDEPVQVTVRVRRRDNGQPPPNGTTVVLSASGGAFGDPQGPTSVALQTFAGQATVAFFPPLVGTSVTIQARIADSFAQAVLRLLEGETFFIASIQPTTGSPDGGDQVTIVGGGFETPVRVTFDGIPAQVLSVTSDRIRVITPPSSTPVAVGSTRPVTVTVTINLNEPEQALDALANAFIYTRGGTIQQPQVFSVSPAAGPNEGGTRVTIQGEGFQAPVQVFFGQGSSATNFTGVEATIESITPNRIVVRTPSATGFGQNNLDQVVDLLIKNLENGFSTVAPSAFQYGSGGGGLPFISAIGPGIGPYTGGTIVTIFGSGFDEPVAVTLGGLAQTVISVTGTEIVFRTAGVRVTTCPQGGEVTADGISVTNIETGETATANLSFTFVVPVPLIVSVSPTSGPQAGGTSVTVSGQGFESPVRVRFISPGGTEFAGSVTSTGASAVVARTPAVPNSALDTESCDDDGDGTAGERYVRTAFDVEVENLATGCTDDFAGAFIFIPSDQSCRNDAGPPPPPPDPQCNDGIDNDGDGLTDFNGGVTPPGDPQCTSDGDDNEAA